MIYFMIKELQILGKFFTSSISTSDRVENCKKSEGCYLFQGSMICFCRMTLLIELFLPSGLTMTKMRGAVIDIDLRLPL